MTLKTFAQAEEFLVSFLNGRWPPEPTPETYGWRKINWGLERSDEEMAVLICSLLLKALRRANLDLNQRLGFIELLKKREKDDATVKKNKCILKGALNKVSEGKTWKDIILGISSARAHSLFHASVQYNNSAQCPVMYGGNRFKIPIPGGCEQSAAVIGSSFTTTDARKKHDGESHVLDAIYCVYTGDSRGERNGGCVIALGDGAGGHFGDERQDKNVARAAHFATKHSARLMACFDDPEELGVDILKTIAAQTVAEVKHKAPTETTTLVCARVFPTRIGYRVIGFNIGDSMLVSWSPQTQEFKTLSPSRVTLPGTGALEKRQEATALLSAHSEFEIHPIDERLDPGSLVFALSDGCVDSLPTKYVNGTYPNGLDYKETDLDPGAMSKLLSTLPLEASAADCINHILTHAVEVVDLWRVQKLEQETVSKGEYPFVLGDDMAMVGVMLPPLSLKRRLGFR